jgi:hypothetical protein
MRKLSGLSSRNLFLNGLCMNIKLKFLCLLTICFLLSCGKNSIHVVNLNPSLIIEELSDSTFFKDVSCITHDEVNIYASDVFGRRILKFDADINYLGSIGSHGQGPGEFSDLGGIVCMDDSLYAIDYTELEIFMKNGNFVRSVSCKNADITPYTYCTDTLGHLYMSSRTDTFPLVKYDRFMNRLLGFGSRLGNEDEKISGNIYMPCNFGNRILSVKIDDPLISMYDLQGKELFTQYVDDEIFKSRLAFKKSEQEKDIANKRKTYCLFESATVSENKIYLLYIFHDSQNRPFCNRIAELIFEDGKFRLTNIYQLKDVWYHSICCFKNKLVCYSATNQEFQLYGL